MAGVFRLPLNFRDVVETAGPGGLCGHNGRRVRQGRLFRSSCPEAVDKNTTEFLQYTLNITRVIDLRDSSRPLLEEEGPFEIAYIRRRRENNKIRVDSFDWVFVKFFAAYQHQLAKKLTVGDRISLGWSGASAAFSGDGSGLQASINRRQLGDTSVVKYYEEMVDFCAFGVVEALEEITDCLTEKKQGACLIHCEYGVERTGLVICIILMLLGVDEKMIVYDFSESEERMDTQAVEKSKAGLHEDYFGAPPRAILGVIRYIQDMHRGVERYLERKGFNEFRQQELRNALLD